MVIGQLYIAFPAISRLRASSCMERPTGWHRRFDDSNWCNATDSKDKTAIVWTGLMHEIFNDAARDQVVNKTPGGLTLKIKLRNDRS